MAGAGFDFIIIDMEHSPTGFGHVRELIMAVERRCAPIVRVKANSPECISAILDLGPAGVMVPRVNTREQAACAVRHAKYHPLGARGFGPYRVSDYTRNLREVLECANQKQMLWVQIEDKEAVENVSQIAAVPGIDAFFRERAIPNADLVTPNHFELEHLTGRTVSTMGEALAAARSLLIGPRLALITSLRRADAPSDQVEMVAVSPQEAWRISTPLIGFEIAPNGTGDAVAALFAAHWIATGDVAAALGRAASSIFAVLETTKALGERELQLVAAQDRMVAPARVFTAEKL